MELNNYDEVIESSYHNKNIRIQCIVTGKSLSPYHVPKTISVQCASAKCSGCTIQEETNIEIDATDQKILQFIDVSTARMPFVIISVLGLTCKSIAYEVKDVQLIERIYVARPTGKERTRKGGGSRPAYVVGMSVETNSVYYLEGYTTVDPISQQVTHVFVNAQKKSNDIENFNLSLKKHSALNEFCTKDNSEAIFNKLEKLYTNYAHNITKIYNRFDLHLCVDLLFRSVISFRFDNEYVHKGWMEAMVVGDTRCGKGYVAEKLVEYFELGETVSGENCSFSGLVGGLQQLSKHWVITWGKIPMNDCGLLVVDESSGMEDDMWSKLSRVRSEGIAEITKIQTEVANARTRLLYLCNPTNNRMISNYSYGIQALTELVKAPEDIARFDYVLVVAHNEVPGEVMNQRREPLPKMYERSLEQDLILWCWSRKPNDVQFTKEAIREIYKTSLKLEGIYDFSIPLIQVENVRFKIAKLAIAFAARVYSNSNNGKTLVVKTCHVECAYGFLDLIYGKPQSGYKAYSTMKKSVQEVVTKEKLQEVEDYFNAWKLQKNELMRCLLTNNSIDIDCILVHLACGKDAANECMSRLLRAGCITKKGGYYYKVPDFVTYLKDQLLSKR
jgi:hypothetical protein